MRALAVLAALFLVSCADEKAVNAAFFQNKVTWYVFDAAAPAGVEELAGFEQPLKVTWKPAPLAMRATALADTGEGVGAVAVSRLGFLTLDDSSGLLAVRRAQSEPDLGGYATGSLFVWDRKTFVTLYRDLAADQGAESPPVSLAWWSAGQTRLAFYPLTTQIQHPKWQAPRSQLDLSSANPSVVWDWRSPDPAETPQPTRLVLATGLETKADQPLPPAATTLLDPVFDPLAQRLAARLGESVERIPAGRTGALLLVTPEGWAAVGRAGSTDSRLYRLPSIGSAGRYTHALELHHGWVIAWQTNARGYAGAAGLVYVPFGVLAP